MTSLEHTEDAGFEHYGSRQNAAAELGLYGQDLEDFLAEYGSRDAISLSSEAMAGNTALSPTVRVEDARMI